jgi:hypothetical protein
MRLRILGYVCVSLCAFNPAVADDKCGKGQNERGGDDGRITAAVRIFSQVVSFRYPGGFKAADEGERAGHFQLELIPANESLESWSQMVTITGEKGLAPNPNTNPQYFTGHMADGFKRACPDTFSAYGAGSFKVSGYDAFMAVIGCGSVRGGGRQYSEAALVITMKGIDDYYTIQWAERGASTDRPMDLSGPKWMDMSKKLRPIEIISPVAGNKASDAPCSGHMTEH